MRRLVHLLLLFPLCALAADDAGIKFDRESSWREVMSKAKAENKYIFLDCFTTWCGWCKEMDKRTFPQEKVGKFFNEKFVSVKVQMDKKATDSDYVRSWYEDAARLKDAYEISGYPIYFFFSPDGKYVHQVSGFKEAEEFIAAASDAFDPNKRSAGANWALLEEYKQGKYEVGQLVSVARAAKAVNDVALLEAVIREYREKQFDVLNDEQLFTYDNMKLAVLDFPEIVRMEGSKGRLFQYLYKKTVDVDKLIRKPGATGRLIDDIIKEEEVDDKLWIAGKPAIAPPDWDAIHISIERRYGADCADRLVWESRPQFYMRTANAEQFVGSIEKQIQKYPPRVDAAPAKLESVHRLIAGALWVLDNTDNKELLARALAWTELCRKLAGEKPNTAVINAMARLLHKLGRREEAIGFLEKAIATTTESIRKANAAMLGLKADPTKATAELTATLEKIKKNEPSWAIRGG